MKSSISLISIQGLTLLSLFSCALAIPVKLVPMDQAQAGITETTGVPVYVMLSLTTMQSATTVNNPSQLLQQLQQLKSGGVAGVMADVWWGLVEGSGPGQYEWSGYQQLVSIIASAGLQFRPVMSFHRCGGNVGDACNFPLPSWVLSIGQSNPDIFYTDKQGNRNQEYLSLGVDNEALFNGLTAVQVYSAYMSSFAQNFATYFNGTISEVEIGLGPAGEMRYPSYPSAHWQFPGVGEFQCYDKYMLAQLQSAASAAGNSAWGNSPPQDAGSYNDNPANTGFFSNNGTWNTPYGEFFLGWYSGALLSHGKAVLTEASQIFNGKTEIGAKVSGIHWMYKTDSHGPELTAGYYNTPPTHDGYKPIAEMFQGFNTGLIFTCLELTDAGQPGNCACGPQELVRQVEQAARNANARFYGENALPTYGQSGYNQILTQAKGNGFNINGFTYLRIGSQLLGSGWNTFVGFVKQMGQ